MSIKTAFWLLLLSILLFEAYVFGSRTLEAIFATECQPSLPLICYIQTNYPTWAHTTWQYSKWGVEKVVPTLFRVNSTRNWDDLISKLLIHVEFWIRCLDEYEYSIRSYPGSVLQLADELSTLRFTIHTMHMRDKNPV